MKKKKTDNHLSRLIINVAYIVLIDFVKRHYLFQAKLSSYRLPTKRRRRYRRRRLRLNLLVGQNKHQILSLNSTF